MERFHFHSLRDTPYNSETEEETSPRKSSRHIDKPTTSGQNSDDWLTNFGNSLFGENYRDHHSPAHDSSGYITELIKGATQGIRSLASDPPGYGTHDRKDTYDTSPQYQYGIHSSSSRDATGKSPDHLDLQHDITQRGREASFCECIERKTAIFKAAIHSYLEILNSEGQFIQDDRSKIIRRFSHNIIKNTNTYQKGLVNTLDTLRKINQKFRKFASNNRDLFPPDSQQALANRLNTQAKDFNREFKFNEDWLKELTNTLLTLGQIKEGLKTFAEINPELFRPALQQELANTRKLNTWADEFKRKLDSNEDWVKEVMNQLGVEEEHFNKTYQEFLGNRQASYSIKYASYSPEVLAQRYEPNNILPSYDELLLANAKFKPIYERLKEFFPVEGIPDRSRVSDPPRYGSDENKDAYHTSPQHRNISSQYGTAYGTPSHASTSKSTDHPDIHHGTTQRERDKQKAAFSGDQTKRNFSGKNDIKKIKEHFEQGKQAAKELIEWTEIFTKQFNLREKWVQDGIKKLRIEPEKIDEYSQQLQKRIEGSPPKSDEKLRRAYDELVVASTMLKSIHDLLKGGIPVEDMPGRICGRKVTQVSGLGNDCLIRALLKGAHPDWKGDLIETGVDEMRQHLIDTKIVKEGAMLDLGDNKEGKQLIDSMKTRGWIEDRDILAYQYLDGKIRCDPIAKGESNKPPYAVLFDRGGIHFYAIEVPE